MRPDAAHPCPGDAAVPARSRILIIEDEPLIALDIEDLLLDAGFEIAGVATTLGKALAMISEKCFEAAILDANLAGTSASPAAVALSAKGCPYVVLSGYSTSQQAPDMRNAPLLTKPVDAASLIRVLQDLVPV